jgi:hypothetical protein
MADPSWLAGPLAAIMIAVAVYCVGRLTAARRWQRPADRDADIAHVAMGVAMAGMLVPRLNPLTDSAWEAVFGVITAWFGWRVLRDGRRRGAGGWAGGHYAPHLLHSGAMLYMLLIVSGPGMGSMGAGGSARFPLLAFGLALALVGYAILDIDRLTELALAGRPAITVAAGRPAAAATWTVADASRGGAVGTGAGPQAANGVTGASGPADPGLTARAPRAARVPPAVLAPRLPPTVLAPRLAAGCRIVLGLTMGYMLIVML